MDVVATAAEAAARVDEGAGPRWTAGTFHGKRVVQSLPGSADPRGAVARRSGDGTGSAWQHGLRAKVTRVIRAACCLSGASDGPPRAQFVRSHGRRDEPLPPVPTARVASAPSPKPEESVPGLQSPQAERPGPASVAVAKPSADAPGRTETDAGASVNVDDNPKISAIYTSLTLSELQTAGCDNPAEVLLKLYREQVPGPTEFDKEVYRAESAYVERMQIGAFVQAAQELAGEDDRQFRQLCALAPYAFERSFHGGKRYRELLAQIPPFPTPSLEAYLQSFDRLDDSVHHRVYTRAKALASPNQ